MNLKELQDMIKEELESYMNEEEVDVDVDMEAGDIDADGAESGDDSEDVLRQIYDMLKDKFEGEDDAEEIEDEEAEEEDAELAEETVEESTEEMNVEIQDYVSDMYNSDVEEKEGFQSGIWEKEEYGDPKAYGEAAGKFIALVKYLNSVGGKATLEGNPDINLELLPGGDIQWKAEVTMNETTHLQERFKKLANIIK